jgi:ABC-type amino acid transport substrate-binding protein
MSQLPSICCEDKTTRVEQLQVIGRPMNKQGYGVAVSPLFPDLADAISIQLTIMQQNGMLVRIKARWLPEVVWA